MLHSIAHSLGWTDVARVGPQGLRQGTAPTPTSFHPKRAWARVEELLEGYIDPFQHGKGHGCASVCPKVTLQTPSDMGWGEGEEEGWTPFKLSRRHAPATPFPTPLFRS